VRDLVLAAEGLCAPLAEGLWEEEAHTDADRVRDTLAVKETLPVEQPEGEGGAVPQLDTDTVGV
jgi:hypothetical protein